MRSTSAPAILISAVIVASWSSIRGQVAPAVAAFSYGGNHTEIVNAIAVDSQYNVYLAGRSNSQDLPGVERGYQRVPRGTDAFVAKLTWDGRVQWATFLGGGDSGSNRFGNTPDVARTVAVDGQGNVYVGGSTGSFDFPTVNAYQNSKRVSGQDSDGFLAKLDPTGSRLLFSTYLGGTDNSSSVEQIVVTGNGELIVGMNTAARQFNVTRDLSTPYSGPFPDQRLIVGRFQQNGMPSWLIRTGLGADKLSAMSVDSTGSITIAGISAAVPCRPVACGGAYLQRINSSGTTAEVTLSLPGGGAGGAATLANGGLVIAGSYFGSAMTLLNPWQASPDLADNGFAAIVGGSGTPEVMTLLPGIANNLRIATDGNNRIHLLSDSRGSSVGLLGSPPIEHPNGPVFTSVDRGDTWNWASRGLIGGATAAVDHARRYLYAFVDRKIFRSVDEGRSWSFWYSFSDFAITFPTIVIDPLDPTIMYVGDLALYRLEQDGRHAVLLRESIAGIDGGFRLLGADPIDGTLWAYSGLGTIEISRDRGRTWSRGRDWRDSIDAIAFNPHRAGEALIVVGDAAFRSNDYGATWLHVTANIPGRIRAGSVAIDPRDARRIYVADRSSLHFRVLISPDNGATWFQGLEGMEVHSIAVSDVPPFQVTASVTDQKTGVSSIMVTGDGGVTWSRRAQLPRSRLTHFRGDSYRLLAASGVSARPFLTRIDRFGAFGFTRSVGMFVEEGQIGAIAGARDGESVIALTQGFIGGNSDVRVIKINR